MLRAHNLIKEFRTDSRLLWRREKVCAVNGVSLQVMPGETLGLVGESGCGKSTLAKMLTLLERPSSGKVWLEDIELTALPQKALRKMRRKIQIVFQDARASFDSHYTVEKIVGESLQNFIPLKRDQRRKKILQALKSVDLGPEILRRFPHELSGGQAQRVGLARALVVEPQVIVLDEPLSSLDLSIQAQILNLLMAVKEQHKLALIFISHDLSAVRFLSDRIAVMYMGEIVEIFPVSKMNQAVHPYTKLLLYSIPVNDPAIRDDSLDSEMTFNGISEGGVHRAQGCAFTGRCDLAREICFVSPPVLKETSPRHQFACHCVVGTHL